MIPYLGEIILFAGKSAPSGFLPCDGRLLSVTQYQILFSLIGTTYGGDGRTTFALPDLRSRAPIHAGKGPGLTPRQLGQRIGVEEVILSEAELPAHTHAVKCRAAQGSLGTPAGNFLAGDRTGADDVYSGSSDTTMNPGVLSPVGSNEPHPNMPPALVINFFMAYVGPFPSTALEDGEEVAELDVLPEIEVEPTD